MCLKQTEHVTFDEHLKLHNNGLHYLHITNHIQLQKYRRPIDVELVITWI